MYSIAHRETGAVLVALEASSLVDAHLAGAHLAGANLPFAVLYGADLRGADLRGASLLDADLTGTSLRECDLRGALLRGADLRGADLRGANLEQADLRDANFTRALLMGARLGRTRFTGVALTDALYDAATCWPGGLDPQHYGARRAPEQFSSAKDGREAEERWENEGGRLTTGARSGSGALGSARVSALLRPIGAGTCSPGCPAW